jgi:hypothetical protein
VSTDAIVRERLAGGEDAFLETLFGPFLFVPKNWRKRFPHGWDLGDPERTRRRREEQERVWAQETAEYVAREAAHAAAHEEEERRKYPYKSSGLYNCPHCGHAQHDPAAPKPKWGDFIECTHCFLMLQFQPYGMHPYEWTPPGARKLR